MSETLNERFKRSPETELILSRMRDSTVGDVLTFDDAADLTGIHDQSRLRGLVRRASKIALHEFALVFWAIQGVGVRRLSDSEIATFVGPEHRKKVCRSARRAKRRLLSVRSFEGLSESERVEWNTGMVLASVIEHVASAKTAKAVSVEIDDRAKFSLATDSLFEKLKTKPS